SQIVSKIVKSSGNINKRSENGQTALQVAAHSGNQQIVETLLEEGASFGVADGKGLSALHYAVIGGHRMIVQTLLRPPALSFRSSNSDINTRRPVPGHSTHRRLPCADPDTTDNTGRSPLHLASAFGSLSMVELLVEGGAN
ncbi:ankyrin, partial [Viridothelium virens]